ncbi:hypothetical protein ABT030_03270 [Streptomyces mirabilis]|uniref:hypothetical protein n=1 Tax=Streptomyces mirabilis TaxID=68239 RepID=UPI003318F7F3
MGRSEETDEPTEGADHAVSGESLDLGKPEPAGATSEPAPRFAVVISGDGSAAIDGEPVPTTEGVSVDAAILDVLHGHARDRNTTVTATISDPSAGYVAFVEVAPDGSSSLLEQQEQSPRVAEQAEHATTAEPSGAGFDDDYDDYDVKERDDVDDSDEDDDNFDGEAYAREQQRREHLVGPPTPPPAPSPRIVRETGSRQSDDEYESPGLLHKPLVVGPVALGVAALVVVPLMILGSGGSDGGSRQSQAARAAGETSKSPTAEESAPTRSSSISTPPTSPSSTASKSPAKPKKSSSPKSGGGATATDTADIAVNRLARSDPSGRHICYRAYLSGQGWQKPVCDGAVAGATSRNRPIKALNIAVSGVGGSAANAFVHDPDSTNGQGRWEPHWTAVIADGRNNYIGSTKPSAPNMSGFAIKIGSGRICQTAKASGYDWGRRGCADPGTDFVFGGALKNTHYLEAVKFTV